MYPSSVPYRNPEALVQFVGESLESIAPQHLLSVRTRKALSEPAGSFEILLKTGIDGGAQKFAGSVEGAADPTAAYWLEKIRPMSLCVIAFGTSAELEVVKKATAPSTWVDSPSDVLKRCVVMLGIVDEVTLFTTMSINGPQRTVRIMGRDMARVLLDDVLRRAYATETYIVPMGRAVDQATKDELLNRATIRTQEELWFKSSLVNGAKTNVPLKEFFEKALDAAPSLNIPLANKHQVREYLRALEIDPRLARLGGSWQVAKNMMAYNGAPWQSMMDLAPKPSTEMFVDTVGLSAKLIVRRPPFARPKAMKGFDDTVKVLAKAAVTDTALLTQLLDAGVAGLGKVDEFATVPSRVIADPYHTVSTNEIVESAISRSAVDNYSMYHSRSIESLLGGIDDPAFITTPILYDLASASRYGTQVMPITVPWGLLGQQGPNGPRRVPAPSEDLVNSVDVWKSTTKQASLAADQAAVNSYGDTTTRTLNVIETVRAYYFYRDNPEFLRGMLGIRARPEVRIGDRVLVPSIGNSLFYVDSVEHTYSFGRPLMTSLAISRGQPLELDGRLAKYDADTPFESQ